MSKYLGGLMTATINALGKKPTEVEYLVVAGGGGGGGGSTSQLGGAGGGGAGGFLTAAGYLLTQGTTYTVTVGSGGAGGDPNVAGAAGSNSTFDTVTSIGGGGGAYGFSGAAGSPGGSGGGGDGNGSAGGTATTGQGFSGFTSSTGSGGGGGGAGSTGYAINSGQQCGGTGIASSITGKKVFYAGGGGGATYANFGPYINLPLGGADIGGVGGGSPNAANSARPGISNTGSGGGGASQYLVGAKGGSGIIIIRYPQTLSPPTAVTGNVQIGYAAGYQIYSWTSSGTVTF